MGDEKSVEQVLLESGIVTEQQLSEALDVLERTDKKDYNNGKTHLTRILVDMGYATLSELNSVVDEDDKAYSELPEEVQEKASSRENYVGKYIKVKLIGDEASSVWKSYDTSDKKYVAIKFVDTASRWAQFRFQHEAETLSKLKHPHIVEVLDYGCMGDRSYLVTQYVDGESLDRLIGRLTLSKYLDVIDKVAEAIGHAHTQGIVHRNLKPSNILINREGHVFVADFGVAKHVETKTTKTGRTIRIMGTPSYMSPEQISGEKIDVRSDIYALGATLYHCITKNMPFTARTREELTTKVLDLYPTSPRKLNVKIHGDIEAIISKCMFKESHLRYQNVVEFRDDIKRFLNGETIKAKKPSIFYFVKKKLKKHKKKLILGTVGLSVVCAALGYPLYNWYKSLEAKGVIGERSVALEHIEKGSGLLQSVMNGGGAVPTADLKDKVQGSITEFTKAIELDETFADSYMYRGRAYMLAGNYKEAISDISRAIELDPKLTRAYLDRISIRFNEIIPGTSLLPIDVLIRKADRNIVREMKNDVAKLEGLEEQKISDAGIKEAKAMAAFCARQYSTALKLSDEVIAANEPSVDAYEVRSIIHFHRFQTSRSVDEKRKYANLALEDLNKLVELNPNDHGIYLKQGVIYMFLRQIEKAIETAGKTLELAPEDLNANLIVANMYLSKGNKDKAVELINATESFERTQKDYTDLGIFFVNRGHIKIHIGMGQQAKSDFNKAVYVSPPKEKSYIKSMIQGIIKKHSGKPTGDQTVKKEEGKESRAY